MMDLARIDDYMRRVDASQTETFESVSNRYKVGLDLGTAYIVLVVLDEENNPIACEKQAASVLRDGVVVDIGGGTTGLAVLKDGTVVQIEDEPTGGTHLTLVLAGNYHIPIEEAEQIKQDYSRHREILPVVKAVVEKMASIVGR